METRRLRNMKYFHVHIYFEDKDIQRARDLFEAAKLLDLFETVKFHDRPIGPHPTGMFEMHFKEPCYNQIMDWVAANRGHFTAMIHQDTGDDYIDHTEHIRWLGKQVPLDFSFFELIIARPELRINPI